MTKVIFLDRDGVINRDTGFGDFIKSWLKFGFLPRAPNEKIVLGYSGAVPMLKWMKYWKLANKRD